MHPVHGAAQGGNHGSTAAASLERSIEILARESYDRGAHDALDTLRDGVNASQEHGIVDRSHAERMREIVDAVVKACGPAPREGDISALVGLTPEEGRKVGQAWLRGE